MKSSPPRKLLTALDRWAARAHRALKTDAALRAALREIEYEVIDAGALRAESMFYDHDLVWDFARSESRHGPPASCDEVAAAVSNLIDVHEPSEVRDFPVLRLDGLASSKGSGYRSLEEFASGLFLPHEYHDTKRLIRFQTDEDFARNVEHFESAFGSERLVYHRAWDGKYFVANSGGSHHLAAVYRQCKEQGREYSIRGRVQRHSINRANCRKILERYYPLVIHNGSKMRLFRVLEDFGVGNRISGLTEECGIVYVSRQHRRGQVVYEWITSHLEPGKHFNLSEYLIGALSTSAADCRAKLLCTDNA
jgi:hypothetical protein